jgi:VanZ family protein
MPPVTCRGVGGFIMLGSTVTRPRRAFRLTVLVVWMLLITYWSDQSTLPIDAPAIRLLLFDLQHRIAHLIAYALLGLLAGWAFEGWRRATLSAIVLTAVFAAADEVHQSWVPGRKARVDDWLFDVFSAALALWVWPRLRNRKPLLAAAAPLVVAGIYAVAVLLINPRLSQPPDLSRASLQKISTDLIGTARDAARHVRSLASG